jgi:hypothetical protein
MRPYKYWFLTPVATMAALVGSGFANPRAHIKKKRPLPERMRWRSYRSKESDEIMKMSGMAFSAVLFPLSLRSLDYFRLG